METTQYIWMNGKLLNWEEAKVHVLTHTLHYGGGAFEGIRAYRTARGPAVFRLAEHIERLIYSSKALQMELPYSKEEIIGAVIETVRANQLPQGYIRPLVYFGYGVMGLYPKNAPVDVAIACWPWGAYLPHETINVKISKYIRIHQRSTIADAKLCGHYVNSILAALEVRSAEYHEALFMDADGRVAEGPGENFFLVKDGVLHTPKLGAILAGITRNTAIRLAADSGIKVVERDIARDEVFAADEAFFTGTAAEITPIRSIDDRLIGSGEVGPVTRRIKDAYLDVVYGRNPGYDGFLSYVPQE